MFTPHPAPDDRWLEAKRRPPRIPPVVVEVPCGAARHRVGWDNGHITFLDHPLADLEFELAMERAKLSRCATLLHGLRDRGIRCSNLAVIPSEIRAAMTARRHIAYLLGHRQDYPLGREATQRHILEEKTRRLTKPIVAAFKAQDLQVTAELDYTALKTASRFAVDLRAGRREILLSYDQQTRTWNLASYQTLTHIIQDASDFFGTQGECCRICNYMTTTWNWRSTQQSRFRSHVRTQRHHRAILAAIDAARRACGLLPPLPEPTEPPPRARRQVRPRPPQGVAGQIALPMPDAGPRAPAGGNALSAYPSRNFPGTKERTGMDPQPTDLQHKIEAAVAKAVADAGCQMVCQHRFANQGYGSVQRASSLDSRLTLSFDFQDAHVTFHIYPGTVTPKLRCGFSDPQCLKEVRVAYIDGAGLRQFLGELTRLVRAPGAIPAGSREPFHD